MPYPFPFPSAGLSTAPDTEASGLMNRDSGDMMTELKLQIASQSSMWDSRNEQGVAGLINQDWWFDVLWPHWAVNSSLDPRRSPIMTRVCYIQFIAVSAVLGDIWPAFLGKRESITSWPWSEDIPWTSLNSIKGVMIHSKLSLRHILWSVISLWEMSRQWSTVYSPETVPFIWQAWCGLWSLDIFPATWNHGFPEKYYLDGTSLKESRLLLLSHCA